MDFMGLRFKPLGLPNLKMTLATLNTSFYIDIGKVCR
jgi:hypothetical protein